MSAPSPSTARPPRWLRALAVVCLAVVCALLVAWRWTPSYTVAQADSWWYLRGALVLSGTDPTAAERSASSALCAERADVPPGATCVQRAITTPRYARIFTSRPGYPLLAAPLVPSLGPANALRVVTALCAVGAALLTALALRRTGSGSAGAGAAAVALLLLPSGYWQTRLLADGPAALGLLGVVWGTLVWLDGRRRGLVVAALALAATFVVKTADGAAMSAALAVLALAAALLGGAASRRRYLAVAALGATGFLLGWVASLVLGLPGLLETVQDLATKHFTKPDVDRPLPYLRFEDVKLLGWVAGQLGQTWPFWLLLLAGGAALVARARWRSVPWLSAGSVGVAAVVAHPLTSEFARLVAPVWIPVAAGIGLAVDSAVRRLGRARKPDPFPGDEVADVVTG